MQNDTKIFLLTFAILLIAIISFSFTNKEISGENVKDITGYTINGATCTARSDTNYANPKSYNSDCAKAYDTSTTSALIMGSSFVSWVSNAEIILNFANAKDIAKISILPYGALTNAKLYFNDDTTPQNLGSVASGQRSEFTPDKKTGINKIKITWTFIGGYQSGIYDIGLIEGTTCNDPDLKDKYTKSCATGTFKKTSTSIPGQPADDTVCTGTNCCDYCADILLIPGEPTFKMVAEAYCWGEGYVTYELPARPTGYVCQDGKYVKETVTGCSAANCGGCSSRTSCVDNNPTTDFGCGSLTTSASCSANADCEWFSALESSGFVTAPVGGGATGDVVAVTGTGKKPCQPKTKCVWTYDEKSANLGHCCGDKEKWNVIESRCEKNTAGNLCYSFYPPNLEEGKGVKLAETPKKACHNVGSVAYGFWVPVTQY